VNAAGQKPSIGHGESGSPGGSSDAVPEPHDETEDTACAQQAQLVRSDSGNVEFVAEVSPEIDQLCATDRYFVSVDDENVACFFRQADGSFAAFGTSSRKISLSAIRGTVCVTIADGEGASLAVQSVSLFDPSHDFEAWQQTSRGRYQKLDCDVHEFRPSRAYAFRLPVDADAEPATEFAGDLCAGENRWVFVASGWSSNLRFSLDGIELFGYQKVAPAPQSPPVWVRSVHADVLDTDWKNGQFRVRIRSVEGIRISGLRVFGQPVALIEETHGVYESEWVGIQLHRPDGRFDIGIAARHQEDRCVIQRHLHLPVEGLLSQVAGRWHRITNDSEIDAGRLARGAFFVQARQPEDSGQLAWVAHEGYRELSVPFHRPGPIRDAAGWGQALSLQQGRFNQPANAKQNRLAGSIVNRGCVRDCVDLAASSSVIVRLRDPIEPSADHRLIVWTRNGQLTAVAAPDLYSVQDGTWQFDWAASGLEFGEGVAAVAVAWRGRRLGAWWLDDWWRAVRDTSRLRYGFDLAHIAPIEGLPLDRIRRKVVVDLLDNISSTATRQRVRSVLNQVFLAAVEQEYIRTNIIRDIKSVRHIKKPVDIYTAEELQAIREQLQNHRSRVLIELMLESGTRPGETWVLRWGDLRDGILHIERTLIQNKNGEWVVSDVPKTKAGRRAIPLSDQMLTMLLDERKQALKNGKAGKSDFMFTNGIGRMLNHSFSPNVLMPLLKKAGVPYRKPHTFRHNAASALLNGGVPVTIVAAILGHEDASITLRVYAHLIGSETEKAKRFWDDQNAAGG
ncbi:MAG: site-specific integrase, partial [Planctomycetaceae bacterium]